MVRKFIVLSAMSIAMFVGWIAVGFACADCLAGLCRDHKDYARKIAYYTGAYTDASSAMLLEYFNTIQVTCKDEGFASIRGLDAVNCDRGRVITGDKVGENGDYWNWYLNKSIGDLDFGVPETIICE